jgi:MFS family permease
VPALFRALAHRNFRFFVLGQALSLTGMWIQMVAQSWLMYQMTQEAFAVAWVAIAQQGPGLLVGPFAGALADRHSRQRMLVFAHAAAIAPAVALAVLVFSGSASPLLLFALALVAGVARAFEIPTRQAFVPELVTREDIPNAIALNSIVFNVARLVGPAIGGFIIALVGEAWCFLANAVLLVPVLFSLLAIRVPVRSRLSSATSSLLSELALAVDYVRRQPILWALLGGLAAASVAGMPYTVLLPSFAVRVLNAGPETYGFLTAAVGVGAILSAVLLAARKQVAGLDAWLVASGVVFAFGLFGLSRSTDLGLAVLALAVIGGGFMFLMAATNTLVQLRVPDELRGRVMSFHTALFIGLFPVGGLLAGVLADRFGEAAVMEAGSFLVGLSVLAFGSILLRNRSAWKDEPPSG